MKVLHVATDVNPINGGPPRSITGLCRALSRTGADVSLFVHDVAGSEVYDLGGCKLFYGTGRGRSGRWREDIRRVLDEVRPDIVHQHGLWSMPLHSDDVEFRRRCIPYIITPRGLLDAWSLKQKKWKKRLALWLYQRKDLEQAVAIHTTCQMESDYARAVAHCRNVFISPNGVNLPDELPGWKQRSDGKRRFLFLSRIHPKKGLLELVRAWAQVSREGWVLEIVGNDSEDYWRVVQDEIDRLGCGNSIIRTPFLDDQKKWEAYRRADVFVLPTHTENFGIVIAEAAYAGLPVITTKGAPWETLALNQAGWWIDIGVEPLMDAFRAAMEITDDRRSVMGLNAHNLIVHEFDWTAIARNLYAQYESLLSKRTL